MRVEVLYFGVLKDLLGSGQTALKLETGATVADLLAQVRGQRADGIWRSLAVAVNREYAQPTRILHEGDEVALLPPVSGGR